MLWSSSSDGFRDGCKVSVQLMLCEMLTWGLVQLVQLPKFLCNCHQAFPPYDLLVSMWCIHTAVLTRLLFGEKKLRFILFVSSDFHLIDSLLMAMHDFSSLILISFSVEETQLPWWVNLSTSFRDLSFSVEMSSLWLKHLNSVLSA